MKNSWSLSPLHHLFPIIEDLDIPQSLRSGLKKLKAFRFFQTSFASLVGATETLSPLPTTSFLNKKSKTEAKTSAKHRRIITSSAIYLPCFITYTALMKSQCYAQHSWQIQFAIHYDSWVLPDQHAA